MRVFKLLPVLLVLGASLNGVRAQDNSCGETAHNREFSVIDRSLFRVTTFDADTRKESLLGTATLVTLHQDPTDNTVLIGHFITAAHIFEGDGSLPKPGKRYAGLIGLRPCSSLPNQPEPGVNGVTEVFHRSTLQEADLSVLRARVDMDLLIRGVVNAATLYVGMPKSIRTRGYNMAYAGFPANAPEEIAPFGSDVTDIRFVPELKRPWALMGMTKTPDEGQSGSPLFDFDDRRSPTPTVYGLVVEVLRRNEVDMEDLSNGDRSWVSRAVTENPAVLVQPIEFDSPILREIPAGSWVAQALTDIRRKDPIRLGTRLRIENVKQPAVDLYYFLKALEDDKSLAMSAALYQQRISDFLAPFSFDSARQFLKLTQAYLAGGGGEEDVRAFASAELGRSRLREADACARKTAECPGGATERQLSWMREDAAELIEADVNRVNAEKVPPGSRSGRYLANLHLDLAKVLRQVSRVAPGTDPNRTREERSLAAAVTLDPKSTPVYDYAGDFLKETERPAAAAAAYQVAATNAIHLANDGQVRWKLRERCDESLNQWEFHKETDSASSQNALRENAPGLYAFMKCDPPKAYSERRFEVMSTAVKETLKERGSRDVAAERAEKVYREAMSRAAEPR